MSEQTANPTKNARSKNAAQHIQRREAKNPLGASRNHCVARFDYKFARDEQSGSAAR
jgi:hypothetical protein